MIVKGSETIFFRECLTNSKYHKIYLNCIFFFTLNTISDYSVELNHSVHEHDKLKFPVPGELTIIKRACVNMANLNWEL